LVAESNSKEKLCVLQGLGFSKKGKSLEYPTVPTVEIMVDGQKVDLPTTPVRSTNVNGITGFNQYETTYTIPANTTDMPRVCYFK
jgi:arabinoxylan arabinofuranohydrolase